MDTGGSAREAEATVLYYCGGSLKAYTRGRTAAAEAELG
jgi:hypothetical protein